MGPSQYTQYYLYDLQHQEKPPTIPQRRGNNQWSNSWKPLSAFLDPEPWIRNCNPQNCQQETGNFVQKKLLVTQHFSHTYTAQGFKVYIFEVAQIVNLYSNISKSCGQQSSNVNPQHFGKDPDPEFAPLTNESGSCYFRYWPSRWEIKIIFSFFAYYFLKLQLHHFQR